MIGYLVMAHLYAVLKIILWDWKDGLEVKSTDCSYLLSRLSSPSLHMFSYWVVTACTVWRVSPNIHRSGRTLIMVVFMSHTTLHNQILINLYKISLCSPGYLEVTTSLV